MTVSSTQTRVSYAGNGATVAFSVPWRFLEDAALLVLVRTDATGAVVTKTLATHYSVTGAGDPLGGTLTMVAAPETGETLFIIHDPELLQELDLAPAAVLPVELLERALDLATHQQQRTRELVDRALRLGDTETSGSGAYDADGNRIGNLADPTTNDEAVTRGWALSNFATASGPSAIPPANSIGDTEIDAADPISLAKIDGLTTAEQQVETNPLPLALDGSHLVAHQKLQYQLLAILNWLDAGARAHAFEAVPASNLPAVVAASVAAAFTGQNELINGSLLVSQRFPSETATGTIGTGVDAYICDECFVFPTGGTLTWTRVSAGLHSGARSPMGLELTGAAGIMNARIGFRLGRRLVRKLGALLANKNVTFGVKVRHSGTTGSLTPSLLVRSTSNTGDDSVSTKFASANMTTRLTQAFPGALAAGNEVAFTHTFDLGAMTDSQNGIEIYVDLGAMNAATIKFTVTDFWLAPGDISASLLPDDFDETLMRCKVGYQKTFPYAVAPAQNAGFTGSLVATGDDTYNCAFGWQHSPPLRFVPTSPTTFVTYNPSALAATPRNFNGDNGTTTTVTPSDQHSYVRFDASGNKETDWHVHATADASFYD